MFTVYRFRFKGWHRGAETSESAGKASDAVYEIFEKNLGLGEKPESRPKAMGDWQDYWADVAGFARERETRVPGRIRRGEGGVRQEFQHLQNVSGLLGVRSGGMIINTVAIALYMFYISIEPKALVLKHLK